MYIDLAYIKLRVKGEDLLALSQVEGNSDEINEERINALIRDASAEMENALSIAGYVVPVVPDDFIKRIVFDIVLYYLYATKYDDEEMKDVYARYNIARQKITEIMNGTLKLHNIPKTSTSAAIFVTNKTIADRLFSKSRLENM